MNDDECSSMTRGLMLNCAILIKIVLAIIQIIGGVISGSLSLAADALHNLSDAGAILVAIVARMIGNKSASNTMTFGYKRAEIVGVLINSASLIAIGVFLITQAVERYLHPSAIDGWIIVWVAGVAFTVDLITALLTYYAGANHNMNIRAVFVHNVADTLASIAVIVAGVMIIRYEFYFVDIIATVGISLYVIYHGLLLLRKSVLIIMQAVPSGICVENIKQTIESIEHVNKVAKIHVWQLDDRKIYFEGCVMLNDADVEPTKEKIRRVLKEHYNISDTTIETTCS